MPPNSVQASPRPGQRFLLIKSQHDYKVPGGRRSSPSAGEYHQQIERLEPESGVSWGFRTCRWTLTGGHDERDNDSQHDIRDGQNPLQVATVLGHRTLLGFTRDEELLESHPEKDGGGEGGGDPPGGTG